MAYADDVLALSPLLYYILNQTGSDNPVESVSGISTSLTAPYTWGVTGPVSGYTALSLSGGYYSLTPRQGMTASITRAAWVKTTSTDATSAYEGNPALVVFGDTSGSVWDSFGVTGGKAEYRRFNNSVWQTIAGATDVNDGTWHHIAATYNHSTGAVRIFVDGAEDGTGTITAHQNQGGINAVGRGYGGGDLFDGSLAHLAAWNSVLADADIGDLALAGAAPTAKSDTDTFTLSESEALTTLTAKADTDTFTAADTAILTYRTSLVATDLFRATELDFLNYSPTPPLNVKFTGHRVYAQLADVDNLPAVPSPSRVFRMPTTTEDLDLYLLDENLTIIDPAGLTVTFDVGTPGVRVEGVDGDITAVSGGNGIVFITIPGGLPPGVYSCRATVNTGTVESPVYRSYPTEPITLIVED